MTRDQGISKDLDALAEQTAAWESKIDGLVNDAESNGAFAHRALYGDVALQMTTARAALRRAAELIGVTGWVKNELDGSVTMEIQGTEEQRATGPRHRMRRRGSSSSIFRNRSR